MSLIDIRYAVRRWTARPGLAITVTLTLGLGIGATTAIFFVVDGVLLRPLPWREPDRLCLPTPCAKHGSDPTLTLVWGNGFLPWPDFRDLQSSISSSPSPPAAFIRPPRLH